MAIVRYPGETANEAVVRTVVEEHAAGRAFSGNTYQTAARQLGATITQDEAFRLAREQMLKDDHQMCEVGYPDFKLAVS